MTRRRISLYGFVGSLGIVITIAVVYVSYTANSGLPLQSSQRLFVDLPNAQRLERGSDVRVGGLRVGQVAHVTAVPGPHPYARLELSLSSAGPIPADSRVQEEPASILGASYLQLVLGQSRRGIGAGQTLPLSNSSPTVQLTDLLDIFDRSTAAATRRALAEYGSGLAGEGNSLNGAIAAVAGLLKPLQRVAAAIDSRQADLGRFIAGLDSTFSALAPVATPLASLLGDGAVTFQALRGEHDALGAAIDTFAQTAPQTTAALAQLDPVLGDLGGLAGRLVPGARAIASKLPVLTSALAAGVTPLRGIAPLTTALGRALSALGALARDPAAGGSLVLLARATSPLVRALDTLIPAEVQCNVIPLWGRNLFDSVQEGNTEMPFIPLGVVGLGADNEYFQHATPSANLHVDTLPHENYSECEAGNEPFNANGQDLSNPAGLQPNHSETTSASSSVTAEAARAGLVPNPPPTR